MIVQGALRPDGGPVTRETVLIIGCGAIGRPLAGRLLAEGCRVAGTTTTEARLEELGALGVEPLLLDLGEPAGVRERVGALRPETVYLTVAAGRGRRGYREVYADGASTLVAALPDSVRRIIYTSSAGVYPQDDGGWVDEDSPVAARSERGRALLDAERALLEGAPARGAGATVLRLCGIWGPDRGPARLASRHAGAVREDGDAWLNLVHEDDIVEALRRLRARPYDGVLNLNDDEPTTRREFYDAVLASAGLPAIRWHEPEGPPSLGKRVRNERIKKHLEFELMHPDHLSHYRRPPS